MEENIKESVLPAPQPQVKADKENKKEPDVSIPLSFVRWLCYSILFFTFLIGYISVFTIWEVIGTSLTLGHFAGQLNKIIDK
jgi:hypothetical protein